MISSHSLFKYKFKAKNDDISAIQKELSNTKQRFYEQKTDRVNEMTELKEKLSACDLECPYCFMDLYDDPLNGFELADRVIGNYFDLVDF